MRSGEHEFKVMGLAPYSSLKHYLPILKKLRKLIFINTTGNFEAKNSPIKLNKVLGDIMHSQRFDNVAGAIQAFTEELIISWINYWVKKTNIKNIAVSGGVL